jgi:hypothetical protein
MVGGGHQITLRCWGVVRTAYTRREREKIDGVKYRITKSQNSVEDLVTLRWRGTR